MITWEALLSYALYLNALICNNQSLIQPLELDFPFHAAFLPQDQHYVALSTAELSPSSTVLCKAPQVLHERQCSWPADCTGFLQEDTKTQVCCLVLWYYRNTTGICVWLSALFWILSFNNYGPITKNTMKSISIERSFSNEGKVHN